MYRQDSICAEWNTFQSSQQLDVIMIAQAQAKHPLLVECADHRRAMI